MKQLHSRITSLPARLRTLPANIKLFMITVMLYGIAVEGISAVLLNLYLVRLGYGTEFIGTLNSAGMLIFALVSLPLGAVKRFTGRQMMQFGQVTSFAGLLGLALSYYATSSQGPLLILFRIVSMIGLSAYFVHQLPFAMEITKRRWHDRILAWTMAAFSLAAFFGSWVGGNLPIWFGRMLSLPLTDPRPYQAALLTAGVTMLPAMLAILLIRDDAIENNAAVEDVSVADLRQSDATLSSSHSKPIIGLVITILLIRAMQTSGIGVMQTFYNVYFDDALSMPTNRIGLISGLGRLLGVPLSLTIPWLVSRFGNFKLVLISLGLIVSLMIPLALIPSWSIASLALISINSMGSLRYLSFIAFTMALVSEKQRSLISGAGEMAIGTGFAISSFVGGYLIAWYGYRELFLFGAALTTVGTITFWIVFRKRAASQAAPPCRPLTFL